MFCSGCGQALVQGQAVCPQCGRPTAAPPPPSVPNLAFEVANYSNRVRALSTVWFIYGGLSLRERGQDSQGLTIGPNVAGWTRYVAPTVDDTAPRRVEHAAHAQTRIRS